MIEALIGAVVGAVMGGIISYVVTMQAVKREFDQSRQQVREDRNWKLVSDAIPVITEILNYQTPQRVKEHPDLLDVLNGRFDEHIRLMRLIPGFGEFVEKLDKTICKYWHDLGRYKEGLINHDDLDNLRKTTREATTALISEIYYLPE